MSWIIRKKGLARSKVKVLGKEAMLAKARRLLPNDVDFVTDEDFNELPTDFLIMSKNKTKDVKK